MPDEARFLKKKKRKNGSQNFGQNDLNQVQNVFSRFLEFGPCIFLETAYHDSLRQCIVSRTGKTHEKKLGVKRAKIGPEIRFFAIFSGLVY